MQSDQADAQTVIDRLAAQVAQLSVEKAIAEARVIALQAELAQRADEKD